MKIAIIGAGAAGMGVASKLSREHENLSIHVFQNHNYISLGPCGIPYFVANDFNKQNLLNDRTTKDFKEGPQYKSKIHFHLNTTVTNVDLNKKQVIYDKATNEQKPFSYDYLVIATGAKANVFPPFNLPTQPKNLSTVLNKEDAINIKAKLKDAQNIVIIGGSYIGLEMAESCLRRKKSVTIIEIKNRLMANVFEPEFSPLVYNEITGTNVTNQKFRKTENYAKVLLNTSVSKLNMQDNAIISLETNTGATITCDLVLLASGFTPNTSFLANNNIKFTKNKAIVINEYGQVLIGNTETNEKSGKQTFYENVFSAGDCAIVINQTNQTTNYVPLATSAHKIARVIANNIMYPYKKEVWPGTLGASIIRIKELELARVGIKDDYWKAENIASVFIKSSDTPGYFSSSRPLYLKLFYDKVSYQILGAEMAGYHKAVLRINALATAIWNKMDARDLQYLDLVYAPPFAKVPDIINIAARKIK